MIILYHAPQSRSSRIIWLLEELGVSYEIRSVSIFRWMTGLGEPDQDNPHPDRRVPALVHDGKLVAESVAIVLYLGEVFPVQGLVPVIGDPKRADYLTWVAWYAAELEPAIFAALGQELAASPLKQRNFDQAVRRLENALAQSPYVLGDCFSLADFLISSALQFARHVFPPDTLFDAYVERCMTRPAAMRGRALDNASGLQQAFSQSQPQSAGVGG